MRARLRLPSGLTKGSGNRMLAVSAAAGALLLATGLLIGRFVVPAGTVDSEVPKAGLVTVPVAFGTLTSIVTLRGEVGYSDAVDVHVNASALSGQAIVTGHVPATDSELDSLSVALEVAGRPLIVLPGKVPSYRTLQAGMSGPDVKQFKRAMRSVGIDAGDPRDATFGQATANAVRALYARIGYPVAAADGGTASAVDAAESSVQSAEVGVESARIALRQASAGPTAVAVREANNSVASAQRALDAARRATPPDQDLIANLEDALALAKLTRGQLSAKPDTRAERLALRAAGTELTNAKAALQVARKQALPVLPAAELLYLDDLPRRVDDVEAVVGAVLTEKAMTVSGASIGLSGTVNEGDATLIKTGTSATFDLPDGGEHKALVTEIVPGTSDDPRVTIKLTPDALTTEQVQQLAGANVRVQVPVGSTQGEVLSVPAAALTAGPGGETRVVVVDGDPRDGANTKTHRVIVDTGLAAEGAVEVRPKDGTLKAGDLVVVGR